MKTYTDEEKQQIVKEIEQAPVAKTAIKEKGLTNHLYYSWRQEFGLENKSGRGRPLSERKPTHAGGNLGGNRTNRYGPEKRAEYLKRWRESGLSKSEFARREEGGGISRHGIVAQLRNAEKEENKAAAAAERKANRSAKVVVPTNGTGSSEHLYCPCCGADILAELGKLVMKLRAMQSIQL